MAAKFINFNNNNAVRAMVEKDWELVLFELIWRERIHCKSFADRERFRQKYAVYGHSKSKKK